MTLRANVTDTRQNKCYWVQQSSHNGVTVKYCELVCSNKNTHWIFYRAINFEQECFVFFFFLTLNCRRSHTLRIPSSPPDRRNGSVLFQLMTLTSDEWASSAESIELGGARISQMRIDWSTEQDAKTCDKQKSTGLRFRFCQIKEFQANIWHCVHVQTLWWEKAGLSVFTV